MSFKLYVLVLLFGICNEDEDLINLKYLASILTPLTRKELKLFFNLLM